MKLEKCTWCGLETAERDGPTHRYLESTPGCWASFGQLLAREFQDLAYFAVHGLTVDAYALQHPGKTSPQTISSANVHLTSLYSYFEMNTPVEKLSSVGRLALKNKKDFYWLEPPKDMTAITTVDVLRAKDASEHRELTIKWARYVFGQWEEHHGTVAKFLGK